MSGKAIAAVAETGVTGHEAAVSPDDRTAYVPVYGNSREGGTLMRGCQRCRP